MKKLISFIVLFIFIISLSGCSLLFPSSGNKTTSKKTTTANNIDDTTTIKNITTTTKNGDAKEKLSTPIVVIDDLGNVSWNEVSGAAKYHYVIDNNGSLSESDTTEIDGIHLSLGQSIKVKAISSEGEEYDSDYSTIKKYSLTQERIDAPVVRIEKGYSKWDQVEGASG